MTKKIKSQEVENLPDTWFVENEGQRLILDPETVSAEIRRLRAIIEEMEDEALEEGATKGVPD
jgi:hypothetical protein